MRIRSKTRRRLLMVAVPTLIISIVVAGAAAVRMHYLRKAAEQGRIDGLAAMNAGDYPTALKELGRYLSRNQSDADILLRYAQARRRVVEPNNAHLIQAISLYKSTLERRPDFPEAERELLDLYDLVGFNTEAIALADRIDSQSAAGKNATASSDANHALQCKVNALMRLQRFDDAQAAVDILAKRMPTDLDVLTMELRLRLKKGNPKAVVDFAAQLVKEHPDDPRFKLLQSIAASLTNDSAGVKAFVLPLVNQPLADPAYTRILVAQLDSISMFDESFAVIQKAAQINTDRDIQRMWMRRMFESGNFAMLVEQTAKLNPAAGDTDIDVLAMRVWALTELRQSADADQIIAALDKRGQTDPAAAKWSAVLRATLQHQSTDPVATAELLKDALLASPKNSILLDQLGEAYLEEGARDKASAEWVQAARVAPEWSKPFVRISRTLLLAGRANEALSSATAAELRAPKDHDAQVSVVAASAANLPEGPSPAAEKLLERIADIQKQFPDDVQLLPIRIAILAQEHRQDDAKKAVQRALARDPAPSEQVLRALAQISQVSSLNLEEACWAASEKAHGLSAEVAFAHAIWLHDRQRDPEAVELLQRGVSSHPAGDIPWSLSWAQFLDLRGDPQAKAGWIKLGRENPKDIRVQWAAISARAVQDDHDFVDHTIDNLVLLLGDDSVALRLMRARWYLQGNTGDVGATQAAILLGDVSRNAPDMVAPRLLLAQCYSQLGNITAALDQVAAASDAQPDQVGLALKVADLLERHGDFARSRQYIDRACQSRRATPLAISEAARLLAVQGDYAEALSRLQKVYPKDKPQPGNVVLAALYLQQGELDKTSEICKQLMEKPKGAGDIRFCSDFYASRGQLDDARTAIGALNGLKLEPGVKESVLGNFAGRYGTPEEAIKHFRAAVDAAPGQEAYWQQLVNFDFATGKIEGALTAADEATKKVVREKSQAKVVTRDGFQVVKNNADLIRQVEKLPAIRPLLMAISGEAAASEAALAAIRDVVSANQTHEPLKQTASKVRQLAERNPRLLPLQIIALQLYVDSKQPDEAVKIANHIMQAFPAAIEPLRVQATVFGSERRWDDALDAAKEWRRRDPSETIDADLAIAGAEINLGNLSAASQQLQPYLDRARQDPDKFSGVILLRASELLAEQKPEDAEKLLEPSLAGSERLRSVWVTLATSAVKDSDRAAAWLQRVTGVTPDNPREQVNLAVAWIAIGKRWNNAAYQQTGTKQLGALAQRSDAPADVLFLWGNSCEQANDWKGAEDAYARALARDPNNALMKNNLAAVLVKNGGDLARAESLASDAVKADVTVPNFLDTLASVQAARKEYASAIANLQKAQHIDPQNFTWRLNLLQILTDAGKADDARAEMRQIASSLSSFPAIPAPMRQRYDALCAKLK